MMRLMKLRLLVAGLVLAGIVATLAGQLPLVAAGLIVLYVISMFVRDHLRRKRGGWSSGRDRY